MKCMKWTVYMQASHDQVSSKCNLGFLSQNYCKSPASSLRKNHGASSIVFILELRGNVVKRM